MKLQDRSRAAMRILSVAIVVAAQTPGLTLGAESPSKPEAVIKGDGYDPPSGQPVGQPKLPGLR